MLLAALTLSLAGCAPGPCADGYGRDAAGNCVPLEVGGADSPDLDSADTDTDTDSGGPIPLELIEGHPLVTTDHFETHEWGAELVAADAFDDYAILAGQGGYLIVDLDTGALVSQVYAGRAYRVSYDPSTELAWFATRNDGIYSADLSDPAAPETSGLIKFGEGWHEDIAADDGRVLVALQEEGAWLLDGDGAQLGVIPAAFAFGAGLSGERAVITDGDTLSLWDLSDVSAPVELDQATLPSSGRDVDFDGARIAVALGGDGAAVFELEDDRLVERGVVFTGGSAASVALEGDYLWTAAWTHVALAWIGPGGPVGLGHQSVSEFATGVGASGGRAGVADWFTATTMAREDGVGGAEAVAPAGIWFSHANAEDAQALTFSNAGAFDLEVTLNDPAEYDLSTDGLTLTPGESGAVLITPSGAPIDDVLSWSSNDPDEFAVFTALQLANQSVGTQHEDFTLQGFAWPDTELRNYSLSDWLGQVVVLVYFASW